MFVCSDEMKLKVKISKEKRTKAGGKKIAIGEKNSDELNQVRSVKTCTRIDKTRVVRNEITLKPSLVSSSSLVLVELFGDALAGDAPIDNDNSSLSSIQSSQRLSHLSPVS